MEAKVFEVNPLITPETFQTNIDHYNTVMDIIRASSLQEVRRQIIKFVFEYFQRFDLDSGGTEADETLFNQYLNGTDLPETEDFDWFEFVTFVNNSTYCQRLNEVNFQFELGNELFFSRWYKFLPNFASVGDLHSQQSSPEIYVDMAIAAHEAIVSAIPNARIGVESRKGGSACDWASILTSNLTFGNEVNDFDAMIIHYYNSFNGVSTPAVAFDETPANIVSAANARSICEPVSDLLFRMQRENLDGGIDGIPHWYTEFGTHSENDETLGPIRSSWFDFLAKLNLWNQLISRNADFQEKIASPDTPVPIANLDAAFNVNPTLPNFDMEYFMGHGLFGQNRASILVEQDDLDIDMDGDFTETIYNYTDLGLLTAMINRFSEHGTKNINPVVFTLSNEIPSANLNDFQVNQNVCTFDILGANINNVYSAPTLWGWVASNEDESECGTRRYLLVNSSEQNCVINGFNDVTTNSSADLFFFDHLSYSGPDLEPIRFFENDLNAIQNNSLAGGTLSAGNVMFFAGDVGTLNLNMMGASPFDVANQITMPPFSVIVVTSDENQIFSAGGGIDFDHFGYTEVPIYSIAAPTSWDADMTVLSQNIEILDGGELTISDCKIQFAPGFGIIVQPGGKLNVNNSTLTSQYCQNSWRGIDVQGITTENQESGLQGWASLSYSEIRNAEIALTNYNRLSVSDRGGILHCYKTLFNDCTTAVHMLKYHNLVNGELKDDQSYFHNCEFQWTEDFVHPNPENAALMRLNLVEGIRLFACHFNNESDLMVNAAEKPSAINAKTSSLKFRSSCSQPSFLSDGQPICNLALFDEVFGSIKGFKYGMYLNNTRANVDRAEISSARGIYQLASNGSVFTNNRFMPLLGLQFDDLSEWDLHAQYGLYLEGATGFTVEENLFDFNMCADNTFGLIVKDSGENDNLIYRNTFDGCTNASTAYDKNKGLGTGLLFECNTYENNDFDVDATYTTSPVMGWGIAALQGIENPGVDPDFSAGNLFLPGGTDLGHDLKNDLDQFTYYHHTNDMLDIVDGIVGVSEEDNLIDENFCEINTGKPWPTQKILADENWHNMQDEQDLLQAIVDGGETELLLTDVQLAQYQDALVLYFELSAESPELSREVMLEAIDREDVLPSALLTLILQSNPHAAKSAEIQDALDDRFIPLDQYQRDMIDQGMNIISNMERIEFKRNKARSDANYHLFQALFKYMNESEKADFNTLNSIIGDKESLAIRYLLIDYYLKHQNYAQVQDLLNAIPTDFSLSNGQVQEYENMKVCFETELDLKQNDADILNSDQESDLYIFANETGSRASAKARSLLMAFGNEHYYEPLVHPLPSLRLLSTDDKKEAKQSEIKIFPNPATAYVVIELNQLEGNVQILLLDQNGKIVMNDMVNSELKIHLLDLNHIASGEYMLVLQSFEDNKTHSKKLIIQH